MSFRNKFDPGDYGEEDNRRIFLSLPAACIIFDPKFGTIVDVNNSACGLYGWSHEEFRMISVWNMHLDSRAYVKNIIWDTMRGRNNAYEFRHRSGRGLIDVSVRAYASPKLIYVLAREMKEEVGFADQRTQIN